MESEVEPILNCPELELMVNLLIEIEEYRLKRPKITEQEIIKAIWMVLGKWLRLEDLR